MFSAVPLPIFERRLLYQAFSALPPPQPAPPPVQGPAFGFSINTALPTFEWRLQYQALAAVQLPASLLPSIVGVMFANESFDIFLGAGIEFNPPARAKVGMIELAPQPKVGLIETSS